MMHVGELTIIGLLLKAVRTRRFRTTQGHSYLTKRRLCSLAFVAHMLERHIRPEKLGWQNCWVRVGTPVQKIKE